MITPGAIPSPRSRERADALAARRRRRREPRHSAARTWVIAAVLLAAVAAVLIGVLALGGGSSARKSSAASAANAPPSHAGSSRARHSSAASRRAASTSVAVLNGTETNGLAHRVSGQLRQRGYARAAPLSGRPPGANQTTVVEYAGGHKSDAEGVARALGVSRTEPIEATVASLASPASVVVIVGPDKAAAGP